MIQFHNVLIVHIKIVKANLACALMFKITTVFYLDVG